MRSAKIGVKGKSYAKNIRLGPEMQRYEEETARHRRFGELCDEIVRINGRICDLRPVPEAKEVMEEGAEDSRSSLMRP
jgi:hypothetical protein